MSFRQRWARNLLLSPPILKLLAHPAIANLRHGSPQIANSKFLIGVPVRYSQIHKISPYDREDETPLLKSLISFRPFHGKTPRKFWPQVCSAELGPQIVNPQVAKIRKFADRPPLHSRNTIHLQYTGTQVYTGEKKI